MTQQDAIKAELEKVRQQMQEFTYIISHDLRAPLRAVKTLADWIMADHSDKLGQEGKEQLELLVNRVNRLTAMLDGILEYSRIGRVCEPMDIVKLNDLIKDVVEDLNPPDHISIKIDGTLASIRGEPNRIRQVFQHLLSNAIRAIDKPQGLIIIACQPEGQFWHISVTDNGCGIRDQDLERIFKLFQTLAPKDHCTTTGVGLTLVQRIVEIHGGQVWATSQVGFGSTFHILWPST